MIGRLRGVLIQKQPPQLLVDVNGVGYEVEAPMTTFYQLPALNSEVTLMTHLVVREDAQVLYGFASAGERALFRQLIKVSGVGAKLALTILSGISAQGFARCVREKDGAALTRLPGVGKKTAERLMVELADRLDEWELEAGKHSHAAAPIASPAANAVEDAVSALVALGYRPQEASRMVRTIETVTGLQSEEIIRRALQSAVK